MKTNSSPNRSANFPRGVTGGFTLAELLVVISIIAVLAALLLVVVQRMKKSAGETKSLAVLRSTLQASILYSAENEGQINTMKYVTDSYEGRNGKYVGDSFWGRLQPYLFPGIATTKETELKTRILARMQDLFGCPDLKKMTGTPFEGSWRYSDGSGLPVPFAFNTYLYKQCYTPGGVGWVRQQQVENMASIIYATYGFGVFDETNGAKPYSEMPKDAATAKAAKIYYLPSERAIVGFLDGHVEFLAPPIAERMIKIDGTGQ